MPVEKIDTQFLKGTVAAVLVRACSECAVQRPDDPVQYVAGWLDKYVQNDGILMKHAISKTAAEEDAEAAAKVCVCVCTLYLRRYPSSNQGDEPYCNYPADKIRFVPPVTRQSSYFHCSPDERRATPFSQSYNFF